MLKNFIIAIILVFVSVEISAQLIINEVSQGSGSDEYVELVVVGTKTCIDSTANLQGWILDDNCGFFGTAGIAEGHYRFSTDPQWAAVPYGTIIVLFNEDAVFPGIIADETDANSDNVYFLPSSTSFLETNSNIPGGGSPITTYTTTGYSPGGDDWARLGMRNGGDVFQTVSPAILNAAYHSVGWGNMSGMDVAFVGSASGLVFQNENVTDTDAYLQTNWTSQTETNGTPGAGNSLANSAWINSMRNSVVDINTTIHETICEEDSFFFDNQYLNLLGTYIDTLVTALGCDSIVTLNLSLEVCSSCEMNLGNDTLICGPVNVQLDAGTFDEYLWQNGSTSQTFTATGAGEFYCQGTNYDPTNLIVNGDFSSGNVNFSSEYNYSTAGSVVTCPAGDQSWGVIGCAGTYSVTTSPNLVHNNFPSCGDQTTGTGNMLITNGSGVVNTSAWCQTIPISQNSDYYFSIWVMSPENANASNVSQLQFQANGVQLGSVFTAPLTSCVWQNYSETWNSGTATSLTLCIQNQNVLEGGNDFAMDDIFFGEYCQVSDTINILNQTNIVDSVVVEACFGESALIFGNNETLEGLYLDTIRTLAGCDSMYLKRYLEVGNYLSHTTNTSICFGDSVFLENAWQTTSNTYYDTLQSSSMCDSLLTTNLSVSAAPVSISEQICTNFEAQEGLTFDTLFSLSGCDSIYYELNTIYQPIDSYFLDPVFICIGDSAEILGNMETESSTYSDTTISDAGCISLIREQTLIVNPLPSISAGEDTSIDYGNSATLNATGGLLYTWNTGEDSSTVEVSPQTTTTYTIYAEDINGCAGSDSVTVFVINEEVEILIPNAFTPNGDNLNDVFKIVNEEQFENISMRVYNRWGEMVFSSTGSIITWDGTFNGVDQAETNYTYFIEATAKTTQEQFKVSSVITIIR